MPTESPQRSRTPPKTAEEERKAKLDEKKEVHQKWTDEEWAVWKAEQDRKWDEAAARWINWDVRHEQFKQTHVAETHKQH
eukprot:11586941-Alexandrium_andersonii.AAC.1